MRDRDIRFVLNQELEVQHFSEPNTLIINEFGICEGRSRIDIAVVNGILSGYEIKSEKDTLERLPAQVEYYGKVFDEMTIVTGKNHLNKILGIVLCWWNIKIAEQVGKELRVHDYRKGEKNGNIDSYAVAQLLWKDEIIDILKNLGIAKGVLGKPREFAWKRFSSALDPSEVCLIVRECLQVRQDWRADIKRIAYDGR